MVFRSDCTMTAVTIIFITVSVFYQLSSQKPFDLEDRVFVGSASSEAIDKDVSDDPAIGAKRRIYRKYENTNETDSLETWIEENSEGLEIPDKADFVPRNRESVAKNANTRTKSRKNIAKSPSKEVKSTKKNAQDNESEDESSSEEKLFENWEKRDLAETTEDKIIRKILTDSGESEAAAEQDGDTPTELRFDLNADNEVGDVSLKYDKF